MVSKKRIQFADSIDRYEKSEYVIVGVPFDKTSSFRIGSRFAPDKIREVSYNFEAYVCEHDIDLENTNIYDYGNIEKTNTVNKMIDIVSARASHIYTKFHIFIGGEHSLTIGVIKSLSKKRDDFSVIFIDAHLDFRDKYLNLKNSHACVARRVSEIIGVDRIVSIGIRSYSKEEKLDSEKYKLNYFTSYSCFQLSVKKVISEIEKITKNNMIYISLDMDGIDPSYAPGVSNPEPFGLNPIDVVTIIRHFSSSLIGFDIVEISPPYDYCDITSILGARIIRDLIGSKFKFTKNL